MKTLSKSNQPPPQEQEYYQEIINQLIDQAKRINLYLVSLFIFLIIFNVVSFSYSQQQHNATIPVSTVEQSIEKQKDILDLLFDNSITSMLLSTAVIAVVGVLITKLKGLKKKLDMIEILIKAVSKMKKQSDDRDIKLEMKLKELENKIESVQREATDVWIRYLSDNSFDRKR